MNQRTLEPFSGAPASAVAAYIGECGDCYRPVGRRASVRSEPGLRRWLAPGTSTHPNGGAICQSCYLKRQRPTLGIKVQRSPIRVAPRSEPLTDREIRTLRRMVGACVRCGWAPDHGSKPHRCTVDTAPAPV